MKIYIAGPMTGLPGFGWDKFNAAEKILADMGHEVRNPAAMGHMEGKGWADYLRRDLRNVLEVDAICVLPGWECSKGARLEVHVAMELGLRVLPLQTWIDGVDEQFVKHSHDGTIPTGLETAKAFV